MAGEAKRFVEAGYTTPKPFLDIGGRYMIEHVMRNIGTENDKFFLIHREEHYRYLWEFEKHSKLDIQLIPYNINSSENVGAACTVLQTKSFINNSQPLIIANSDQYVQYDLVDWWESMAMTDVSIMTFECPSKDPKWSYAEVEDSRVIRVAEKVPISTHATVGVYYFKHGSLFVNAAEKMISKGIKTNGEYYVCPSINELVKKYHVEIFPIQKMYGLGVPEDYNKNRDEVARVSKI